MEDTTGMTYNDGRTKGYEDYPTYDNTDDFGDEYARGYDDGYQAASDDEDE